MGFSRILFLFMMDVTVLRVVVVFIFCDSTKTWSWGSNLVHVVVKCPLFINMHFCMASLMDLEGDAQNLPLG